jgi:hypothetical protein
MEGLSGIIAYLNRQAMDYFGARNDVESPAYASEYHRIATILRETANKLNRSSEESMAASVKASVKEKAVTQPAAKAKRVAGLFPDVGYDKSQQWRVRDFFAALATLDNLGIKPRIEWEESSAGMKGLAVYPDSERKEPPVASGTPRASYYETTDSFIQDGVTYLRRASTPQRDELLSALINAYERDVNVGRASMQFEQARQKIEALLKRGAPHGKLPEV